MICVECTNPEIECLFSEFKSKYVQLTVCPKCGKFADSYVEYDQVILFLDLMLLRPQAYRHVAFNVVEESIFKQPNYGSANFFKKYRQIMRYFILSTLFEVYLKWAYEEKTEVHSLLKSLVLSASPVWQYSFFVAQQLVEKLTFFGIMLFLFMKVAGWGQGHNKNLDPSLAPAYFSCVFVSTLLMSLAVRSLPILMLIWPYDNAAVASVVVDVLGVFNTVEALRINTNRSYFKISLYVAFASIVSICVKQMTTSVLVAYFSGEVAPAQLIKDEYNHFIADILPTAKMIASKSLFYRKRGMGFSTGPSGPI